MAERVQLGEQDLDDVVGGCFHYQYNKKGDYLVKVDGIGVFYAQENAKRELNLYNAKNPGLTHAELTEWAKSQGLFWDI